MFDKTLEIKRIYVSQINFKLKGTLQFFCQKLNKFDNEPITHINRTLSTKTLHLFNPVESIHSY